MRQMSPHKGFISRVNVKDVLTEFVVIIGLIKRIESISVLYKWYSSMISEVVSLLILVN